MIRKILVGLDPDEDTPHAIDYAIRIADSSDASITGLAVVDESSIETSAATELYLYKAPMMREKLSEDTRQTARGLVEQFQRTVETSDVEFAEAIEEGVPFERIVNETKYHDLLILGREPHFFYAEPEQRTDTLEKVVTRGISPVLVVTEPAGPVQRVLVAYDRSVPAARAMQQFVQQQPFGRTPVLEIVNARSKGEKARDESDLLLRLAKSYCSAHNFKVSTSSIEAPGNPGERILGHAVETKADLIVAGAHAMSPVRKWVFGSTTEHFLTESKLPLFLYH